MHHFSFYIICIYYAVYYIIFNNIKIYILLYISYNIVCVFIIYIDIDIVCVMFIVLKGSNILYKKLHNLYFIYIHTFYTCDISYISYINITHSICILYDVI